IPRWPTRGPQTWPDRAEAGHLSGSRLERRPVDHHPDDVGGGKRALTRAHPSGAGDPAARALLHDRLDVHRGADRAGRQVLQVCRDSDGRLARSLEPGETTVGVSAHLAHLAASPVGATVDVEAVVQERTGRRITCTARMSAGERTLATANIVRVVVNRATFEAGTG